MAYLGRVGIPNISELLNIDHPRRDLLPQLPQLSLHRMRLYTFVGSKFGALYHKNPRAVAAAHLRERGSGESGCPYLQCTISALAPAAASSYIPTYLDTVDSGNGSTAVPLPTSSLFSSQS